MSDDLGNVSDGYHTFNELYEYRMLYHAYACQTWLNAGLPVVKSKLHSDGEEPFGGGWFIVSAQLPTGQVTNHYELDYWDLFKVPVVDRAPEWDGHTPRDVADRLREHLKKGGGEDG
ncbi:WDGH domain-containing protein [Arcanobacterium haemolyticum]